MEQAQLLEFGLLYQRAQLVGSEVRLVHSCEAVYLQSDRVANVNHQLR